MKEELFLTKGKVPITEYPLTWWIRSADDRPLKVTIKDEGDYWGLYLYVPSTDEEAKIANCTSALSLGVILGEFERKYEAVFAHVVHHRQTIPVILGERGIYNNLPDMP